MNEVGIFIMVFYVGGFEVMRFIEFEFEIDVIYFFEMYFELILDELVKFLE